MCGECVLQRPVADCARLGGVGVVGGFDEEGEGAQVGEAEGVREGALEGEVEDLDVGECPWSEACVW